MERASNELVAGPELDRFVAEKVMGWESISYPTGAASGPSYADGWYDPAVGNRGLYRCASFEPSTNIAHAWEVAERMRSLGFIPSVEAENDGRWFVSWEVGEDGKENYGIGPYADTAPHAICRAALMAVTL